MPRDLTEDAVRDLARSVLGLTDRESVKAGVGQLTTFNQLGFPHVLRKPDGWWLPENKSEVAMILETKATRVPLGQKWVDDIIEDIHIVESRYEKVVGILYNGEKVRAFKGEEEIETPDELQPVEYYLAFYDADSIDKELIYELTARINHCLHFQFGIKNLYHRMILPHAH